MNNPGPIHCSPPNTVIGIETRLHDRQQWPDQDCSPPNTVIGIETPHDRVKRLRCEHIVALLIPSSVLKLAIASC